MPVLDQTDLETRDSLHSWFGLGHVSSPLEDQFSHCQESPQSWGVKAECWQEPLCLTWMSGACRQKPSTLPRNRWNTAEQLSYQPDAAGLGVLVIPGTIIALLGSASCNSRGCPSHAEHCSRLFPILSVFSFSFSWCHERNSCLWLFPLKRQQGYSLPLDNLLYQRIPSQR